ncbi:hypothetical protein GWI33_015442 [Rhynchophorus ferrugineus]|uniref:Uncharacterized protein n=1 Tax=Rhynchophorus ferrugineus TaxID=354439 RepID=A0A834M840_RHYFE|nr:hypothetical protein GWI33_015442 [Rhynchophorus ferrugineus]
MSGSRASRSPPDDGCGGLQDEGDGVRNTKWRYSNLTLSVGSGGQFKLPARERVYRDSRTPDVALGAEPGTRRHTSFPFVSQRRRKGMVGHRSPANTTPHSATALNKSLSNAEIDFASA